MNPEAPALIGLEEGGELELFPLGHERFFASHLVLRRRGGYALFLVETVAGRVAGEIPLMSDPRPEPLLQLAHRLGVVR